MARSTPHVHNGQLTDPGAPAQPIPVGTATWYNWLTGAASFAFTSDAGRFTARKEQRGREDGYWRAYRRRAGKLRSAYLGRTPDLSLDRLQAVANALDEPRLSPRTTSPLPMLQSAAPGASSAAPFTAQQPTPKLPDGTVTFLLCAIGDGHEPPMQYGSAFPVLVVFQRVVAEEQGVWFSTGATDLAAAFTTPVQAMCAALHVQCAWAASQPLNREVLPMRVAIHTGVVAPIGATYHGHTMQLVQHLLVASRASQLLLSHTTAELVRDHLPGNVRLHDLGRYMLDMTNRPQRVYQLIRADQTSAPTALSLPARRPHNLPRPLTPLVGREMDIAAAIASLQQSTVRLLTLTGPGGVGKTRLALAVATALREYFADGCFFVDLAVFHTPDLVTQQIAQTLGVADAQPQALLPRLCDYLATRSLLLVLDNVEQVRSLAPTLAELLGAAPGVQILATSRAVLRLAGEHEYPVAPLALPGIHVAATLDALSTYPAVRLFVERAQAARPDFVLTAHNAATVAAICQQLDGLPLAIELAAVRCRLFSPDVLLQRLARRLALLTGGAQDLPARQQTLRATLDWSYRLLDPAAQALLEQLAVFAGGFTLEAAEAVCCTPGEGDALVDGLAELVDQSLLQGAPTHHAAPRFTMLETLHEYAAELLDGTQAVYALHERHARYYCMLAERAATVLDQEVDCDWLEQLEAERANMRTALRWLLEQHQFEMAARLASALAVFWDLRSSRREGYGWLAAILVHTNALSLATRAKTQYAAGYLARALHDRATAIALFTASATCYRALPDRHGLARALQSLTWTQINLGGDMEQSVAWLDESLAIARTIDDAFTIGWALQCHGWIEQHRALGHTHSTTYLLESYSWVERFPGSLAAARALHAESLAVRRATGNPHGVAWALVGLGLVAAAQRDTHAARAYHEERLAIERSLGNNYGVAEALRVLGALALRQGDYATARTWLIECLALARELGERYTARFALMFLGEVAHAEGDRVRAAALFDEALTGFAEEHDTRRTARIAALRAQMALEDGDLGRARTFAAHSLADAQTADDPALVSFCLSGLADSAARSGQVAWAVQLWGAAERQLEVPTVRRVPIEPDMRARLQAEARRALGERTCMTLWSIGRNMAPAAALEPPSVPTPTGAPRAYGLTRREIDVLRLLTAGRSNAEIAAQLVISLATVNTYLSAIYRKINVSSRTAAMRFALDHLL